MKNVKVTIALFILGFSLNVSPLYAQAINADSLYASARSHAHAQRYDSAISHLRILLANHPERYDAHLLLSSIYGWQQKFEPARATYQTILSRYPTVEVYRGAGRIEMWDAAWADALALLEQGLAKYPEDDELKLLKAQTLVQLGRAEEAVDLLEEIHSLPQADSLINNLRPRNTKHTVRASYYYANFDALFTPWHIGRLEYERRTKLGPVISRVSRAGMFDNIGHQAEIDLYPKIASRTYAYINGGVSDRRIFPDMRWGAELFQGFGSSLEISGGLRMLYFGSPTVRIYTVQFGHYAASHWISARAFLTNIPESSTVSGSFTYRRYLKNSDHYLSLYTNYGNSPIQVVSLPEILLLNTQRLGIDYKHPFWNRTWLLHLLVDYQKETYSDTRKVNRWGLEIGLDKRF